MGFMFCKSKVVLIKDEFYFDECARLFCICALAQNKWDDSIIKK
jgi:hypothetical protein